MPAQVNINSSKIRRTEGTLDRHSREARNVIPAKAGIQLQEPAKSVERWAAWNPSIRSREPRFPKAANPANPKIV